MPKKSVRNRNQTRIELVEKYRVLRDKLREDVSNIHLSEEDRWEASKKLQALPRNTSPSRRRNRCTFCGRPRAYNRLTGLCRLHMRSSTMNGMIPGMRKASW